MLSAAAVAGFKVGSAERGRTIFEDVLRNYPKRTDLCSVYPDQARGPGRPPWLAETSARLGEFEAARYELGRAPSASA